MKRQWEFFESLGEPVYVSDIDTYELVYMNKKAREIYGASSQKNYAGKKCYEFIQHCAKPCAMCNKKDLKPGIFTEWMFYNPILERNLSIKNTLIEEDGRRYRMEVAVIVDPNKWKGNIVSDKNDFYALVNDALRLALKQETPEKTIEMLLEYIGKYLKSERAYLFEKNPDGTSSNTYEWCAAGIEPMKPHWQNMSREMGEIWYKPFSEDKLILIKDVEDLKESDPIQYKNLKQQKIKSAVAVPIYNEKEIIGFYGLVNPAAENIEISQNLLQTLMHFFLSSLRRRDLISNLKLEEQKRTALALEQEMTETIAIRTQENLDIINDIIGSGMWTIDFNEKGEVVTVNYSQRFREMLGFADESEFPSNTESWKNRLHPDDRDEQLKNFWDAALNGKEYDAKYRALKKDGEYAWFHGSGRVTRYPNGMPRFFVGTFINITEKLKAEQALEDAYHAANRANAAKTEFLASMSHDIRTPLNAIIGMTAIAGASLGNTEKMKHCLTEITTSSKHLLALINEVLDMNKIESGKVNLNEGEFNLANLIDDFVAVSKPLVKSKRHDFIVNIHDIKHENVIGDAERIQQCLMNFMSNAVKYTPEGGKIILSITEKPMNKSKIGCYEFIFEDNGIGMSEDFIKVMFEPFSRAEDERAQKQQGTGLGMSITRTIIKMMNGDIKVESQLNKGTKITTTLFLELQDSQEKADYNTLIDLPVLVADDDKTSCEAACFVLNDLGMKSEWVLSGKEAIQKIMERHEKNDNYFAVIIDWRMPEMDGVETTRRIRQAVGNEVPIIIISAYDWTDIESEARAAGADAFISKPIFKSKVAHTFLKLTGKEKTSQEASGFNTLDSFRKENFSGARALLVEDNEVNAEIAKEILAMTGLEVEIAWNGKEAVEKMQASADGYYSLIFMDIQMPVLDGYGATQQIRASDRKYLKDIPIIAMSANAFAEDVAKSKAVGMNEHIAKPLDFNNLLRVLNTYIQ